MDGQKELLRMWIAQTTEGAKILATSHDCT